MTDKSLVEIGGQTMTQAQFAAARFPLLNPTPSPLANPFDKQMQAIRDLRGASIEEVQAWSEAQPPHLADRPDH